MMLIETPQGSLQGWSGVVVNILQIFCLIVVLTSRSQVSLSELEQQHIKTDI